MTEHEQSNLLRVAPWVAAVIVFLVVTLVILVAFGTLENHRLGLANHQQNTEIIALQKENHTLLVKQDDLDTTVKTDTAQIVAFGNYQEAFNTWTADSILAFCNKQDAVLCLANPPLPPK